MITLTIVFGAVSAIFLVLLSTLLLRITRENKTLTKQVVAMSSVSRTAEGGGTGGTELEEDPIYDNPVTYENVTRTTESR